MNKINSIIATSIITTLLVLAITFTALYANRGVIFEMFASNYISGTSSETRTITRNILAEESQIISIVEKANPSVVSIVITKDVPVIEQYFEDPGIFPDFFGFDFQIPRQRQNGTEKREIGGGTGFVVSKDGMVVTNRHVVSDTKATYTAFTNDGKKYDVEVAAVDPTLDIAILKLKGAKDMPSLAFGDSDTVKLGQTAIAIGNALGEFRNSVSAGVISGLARTIIAGDSSGRAEQLDEVIQTDAAINPGNSGGPLLDLTGRVIGVNVAVAQGSENIGFALPANVVKSVVDSVQKYGEIVRPYIGVRYIPITAPLKERNNLSVDYGVLVQRGDMREELAVVPNSPADKAGIVENDIILEIDGTKLDENHSLASIVRKKSIGDKISLRLLSKGKEKTILLTLEKAPKNL
ncbi:MAG: hypothetical protein A2928_00410 [Candidatus Taylorbacteria bacterium RIFCSPLOWO2_01_FULL_45_15b]|uniref:PDZ domain-containing protein n=1 Tax=Candidatus Taylorbacteria bacterium RIFCSPLOWO2_01_FULL_45_15b TaxID=1802319 RepID=A0A1G2N7R2_9BACT|nr:MAG: hypothetical protein A2928_00410 [Candidatus Taylorbacteria bacterium RIFCSPLOWO2_01_FULL_45_15b]